MALWFFPTYLILRLAEALPMNFKDCSTLPELWEYQCPKFNLLIRIAFILGLSISSSFKEKSSRAPVQVSTGPPSFSPCL